jgi:hypothetical protein
VKISYSKEEIKSLIEKDLRKMNATNVSIELISKRTSDSFIDVSFDVGSEQCVASVQTEPIKKETSIFDNIIE